MIGKHHNHTLQTNPRHCKEAPQITNNQKTSVDNQLALPQQDDCKTRKDKMKCLSKNRLTRNPYKQCELHKTMNQEHQNYRLRTDSNLSHRGGGGGGGGA